MNKKVIVTGVQGQDGSLMVDYLMNKTDYEIYGFGVPTVPRFSSVDNISQHFMDPRFSFIPLDITNKAHMDQIIAYVKPDYYINFAAQTNVVLSKEKPEETLHVNYFPVLNALDTLYKVKKDCRYFNAGSSEEFSPAEVFPQNENCKRRFNNPYGISKTLAHHAVEDYRQLGMFAIQPYLYNHIGPRSNPSFFPAKLANFVAAYRVQQDINTPFDPAKPIITNLQVGNINAVRDWTAAEEVIEAIWLALSADVPKDYVIASGKGTSVKKLIEAAIAPEIENSKSWIDGPSDWYKDTFFLGNVPFIRSVPEFFRPEEDVPLVGDSTLISNDLGWKASKPVESIIETMINKEIDRLGKRG